MFHILTDAGSNLTTALQRQYNIGVVPMVYTMDGAEHEYPAPDFNGKAFYDGIRAGAEVKTSLANADRIIEAMRPLAEAGNDVLFISLSAGISGTYKQAEAACEQIAKEYNVQAVAIDSLGAGLGEGLLAILAAKMRSEGADFATTVAWVRENILNLNQHFVVGELKYLHKTGRISAISSLLGSVLNIKPILTGSKEGKIVSEAKVKGRRPAMNKLLSIFNEQRGEERGLVAITHTDAPEEACRLADEIRATGKADEVIVEEYEPITGSHVGPGTVALFFMGLPRLI